MTIETFNVQNPNALLLDAVRGFIFRALSANSPASNPAAALIELAEVLPNPDLALLMIREDGRWAAFALVEANRSALQPKACTVLHFYNEGSHEARTALIKAVVEFTERSGHREIIGLDMNNRPDAFQRIFRYAGEATEVGKVFRFDIGGSRWAG